MVKALGCPVCLDQLTAPVVQCKYGHNTCSRCKSNQCPLCRGPFIETPNRVLDKMLTMVTSAPCPNAKSGCTSMLSESHQAQWCSFRLMTCPQYNKCKWNDTARSWFSHVQERHYHRGLLLPNEPTVLDGELFRNLLNMGCTFEVGNNNYFFHILYTGLVLWNLIVKCVAVEKPIDKVHDFKIDFNGMNNSTSTSDSLIVRLRTESGIEDGFEKSICVAVKASAIDNAKSVVITAMTV